MKTVLLVVINLFLLVIIVIFFHNANTDYSEQIVEMGSTISDLSGKIKSGEEVLSPSQYSEILDIVNDVGMYYYNYLNEFTVLSFLFYILSVFMFYLGVFVGKRDK